MYMRISSVLAASALLAGCGSAEPEGSLPEGSLPEGSPVVDEASDQLAAIDCAVGAGAGMGLDCTVETTQIDGETVLVISHPDGGFRRLKILPDGAGLEALDGADQVSQTLEGNVLEISVGDDRYRLPAAPVGGAPAEDDGAGE